MEHKYREFCVQFEAAERRLKQFEKINFELYIPAMNQLRYAACHLKESFQAENEEEELASIKSAERHCRRAIHDASEATVDYVAMWVAEFVRGFRYVPISTELPDHVEMLATIREAVNYVAEHNHETADDPDVIDALDHYVEKLIAIRTRYENARDPLNKRARIVAWKALGAVAAIVLAFAAIVIPICCRY